MTFRMYFIVNARLCNTVIYSDITFREKSGDFQKQFMTNHDIYIRHTLDTRASLNDPITSVEEKSIYSPKFSCISVKLAGCMSKFFCLVFLRIRTKNHCKKQVNMNKQLNARSWGDLESSMFDSLPWDQT